MASMITKDPPSVEYPNGAFLPTHVKGMHVLRGRILLASPRYPCYHHPLTLAKSGPATLALTSQGFLSTPFVLFATLVNKEAFLGHRFP